MLMSFKQLILPGFRVHGFQERHIILLVLRIVNDSCQAQQSLLLMHEPCHSMLCTPMSRGAPDRCETSCQSLNLNQVLLGTTVA